PSLSPFAAWAQPNLKSQRRFSTAFVSTKCSRPVVARAQFAECVVMERPLMAVGSTDRCNTFCELLSWGLIEQGLSRPFIELPCDRAEPGLAMQGQIGATRKILAQQSVGVFV